MSFWDKFLSEELKGTKIMQDIYYILAALVLLFAFFYYFDVFAVFANWIIKSQLRFVGSILLSIILLSLIMPIFTYRRWKEEKAEITKRRQFEMRMEKSSAQLQAVLDGVPDMILQVDINQRILWANKTALTMDKQAIGKLTGDAFHQLGESVIGTFTKWAMTTGIIEKGVKFQPGAYGADVGSYWEGIGVPLRGHDGTIFGAIAIARDVSERMRMEHTTNLLASIVESTEDAIYGMSYDATVLSWNIGAETIYGYKPGEIVGKTGLILAPAEIAQDMLDLIETVIRNQSSERIDTIRKRKDGKEIYVSVTLCPFVDAMGRKIGVSAIDRDITTRKRAEEALIESETRFRELFENMSSGVAIHVPIDGGNDFIIKDFNRAGELAEKINKASIIGKRVSVVYSRGELVKVVDIFRNVWKSGVPEHALITLTTDDRTKSWRDISVYKLPSEELVVIYDDITERKKAEEALETSEEKFRTLVETAPDGIVLFDPTGRIIEYNRAFADLLGFGEDQLDNMTFPDIIYYVDGSPSLVEFSMLSENQTIIPTREFNAHSKWGNKIPVEISMAALREENYRISAFIATIRDISIRKRYELELRESREQMRSLAVHLQTAREEERKRIAFEIHDELGYALTALKLDLVWLTKKTNITDGHLMVKSREMSELIETTIQKVRTISAELRPSILDHFGLIAAIEEHAGEFQKRTAVRCKVMAEPKDVKFSDRFATAIFRIFQETLTNVARHSKASRVDVSFFELDESYVLMVSDNGIGINPDNVAVTKSLGLVGMRERAKSIGALLEIGKGEEGGTTMTLTIPKIKGEVIENETN